MSFLPSGYPLKYKRSTGDMANSVFIGPSPRGDDFVNITYERGGEVVHHDCAPLKLPPKLLLNLHPSARALAQPAAKEGAAEHVQLFCM